MKISKFVSNYIKSADLKKPQTVTISTVEVEKFEPKDRPAEEKLVLYTVELDQGVVLCKAAILQLEELFGDETDGWLGKKVVIFCDPNIMFGGKRVGGIRFKAV